MIAISCLIKSRELPSCPSWFSEGVRCSGELMPTPGCLGQRILRSRWDCALFLKRDLENSFTAWLVSREDSLYAMTSMRYFGSSYIFIPKLVDSKVHGPKRAPSNLLFYQVLVDPMFRFSIILTSSEFRTSIQCFLVSSVAVHQAGSA